MKSKPRKFKVNDRVRVLWSKDALEQHGCGGVQIIRRFDNDYEGNWYYVSSPRSLVLWLIRESELCKINKKGIN